MASLRGQRLSAELVPGQQTRKFWHPGSIRSILEAKNCWRVNASSVGAKSTDTPSDAMRIGTRPSPGSVSPETLRRTMGKFNKAGKKLAGLAGAGALALSGFGLIAPAATADEAPVQDAVLSWGLSQEASGGAYFGGCNFLVAGKVGDLGSSHVWNAEEGKKYYKTEAGNVSVTRPYGTPTWDTKCLGENGKPVRPYKGSTTHSKLNFAAGTGKVDVAKNTADVQFKGEATVVFYGGMTYWSFSNPHLVINADGTGKITATASGYAASMEDLSKWEALPEEQITMATFKNAKVTETGFTALPEYAGVAVDVPKGFTAQSRTEEGWGAFPQEFVNFQLKTGQSSYWYSSGGASDPKKPATEVALTWKVKAAPKPAEPSAPEEDEGKKVDITVGVPEKPAPNPTPGDGDQPNPAPGDGDQPAPAPGEGDQPGPVEPGEFTYSIASTTADLGTAEANAAGFAAVGQLPAVTVKDTRAGAPAFTVNGQVTDFTGSAGTITAAALGWTPQVSENTVGAVAGKAVDVNKPGLGKAATLVSAPQGHAAGSVKVGAQLRFQAPQDAQPGQYRSVLTITAIG